MSSFFAFQQYSKVEIDKNDQQRLITKLSERTQSPRQFHVAYIEAQQQSVRTSYLRGN
jgi:hypothetical protein